MNWSIILTKLQSRKLWVALGSLVAVWVTPGVSNNISAIITGVIAAGYAIAQGIVDAQQKPK